MRHFFFKIPTIKIPIFTEIYVADRLYNRIKKMHAHNKKHDIHEVHEKCPYVKYRHYHLHRKTKCTHTTKNSALISDGGGRVMKMVPMSNIATTRGIEKQNAHTHTTTTTTKITPHTSIDLLLKKPTTTNKHTYKQTKQKTTTAYAQMDHNNGRRSTYNGRIINDWVKQTTSSTLY